MQRILWLKVYAVIISHFFIVSTTSAQELDVPYVSTPHNIVRAMLDMANVGPGDFVIDLGSGDGRIVIAAAKRGAYAIGVDIDPERIVESNENAENEGVAEKVKFLEQNIFETDLSKATVVTMYLLNSVNIKLKPTLFEQLRPGTRVVSHSFHMGEWEPDAKRDVEYLYVDIYPYDYENEEWQFDPEELDVEQEEWDSFMIDLAEVKDEWKKNMMEFVEYAKVYYWVIPANVKGNWLWETNGEVFNMVAKQQFQKIDIEVRIGESKLKIDNPLVKGERISFAAFHSSSQTHYAFSGRVDNNEIDGSVIIKSKDYSSVEHWNAKVTE